MKVIVCGSRDWADERPILVALSSFAALNRNRLDGNRLVVIHGGARGADSIAGAVARRLGLEVHVELADWVGRDRGAGHERNRRMLGLGPDRVLAFKNGFDRSMSRGGTENMCRIAIQAGVSVLLYDSIGGWEALGGPEIQLFAPILKITT